MPPAGTARNKGATKCSALLDAPQICYTMLQTCSTCCCLCAVWHSGQCHSEFIAQKFPTVSPHSEIRSTSECPKSWSRLQQHGVQQPMRLAEVRRPPLAGGGKLLICDGSALRARTKNDPRRSRDRSPRNLTAAPRSRSVVKSIMAVEGVLEAILRGRGSMLLENIMRWPPKTSVGNCEGSVSFVESWPNEDEFQHHGQTTTSYCKLCLVLGRQS